MVVRILSGDLEELEGEGRSYQHSFHPRRTHNGCLEGSQRCSFPSDGGGSEDNKWINDQRSVIGKPLFGTAQKIERC